MTCAGCSNCALPSVISQRTSHRQVARSERAVALTLARPTPLAPQPWRTFALLAWLKPTASRKFQRLNRLSADGRADAESCYLLPVRSVGLSTCSWASNWTELLGGLDGCKRGIRKATKRR